MKDVVDLFLLRLLSEYKEKETVVLLSEIAVIDTRMKWRLHSFNLPRPCNSLVGKTRITSKLKQSYFFVLVWRLFLVAI